MRRPALRHAALIAAAACLLTGGLVPGAAADSVGDRKKALDQQIAQLRDELEGTSREFADAAVTLKRSQAELTDVRARLTSARAELARARREDAALASRLAYAQAEESKARAELDAQRKAEAATRAAIGRIARQTYVDSGLTGLSLALRSDSPDQFADQLAFAGAALQSQSGAVHRLAVQQADLRARGAKLTAIREQVTTLKVQSAAAVRARQAAETAAQAAETRQSQLVAEQAAAVAVIKAKADEEKARLDKLRQQQAKLAAELAARARKLAAKHHASVGTPPPSRGGVLGYPASGPVTSGYGMRYHPVLHIWRLHSGTDFGIACGTPVYAAAAGSIVRAGWAGGYGNRVVIDHGWLAGADLATTYNHLTRIVVHSGSVRRGQLIAYSGTTGLSTGCHLHFEVLVNGSFTNPMNYL